ncbi:MAG: mechanosensitive ion channel [Blastocatellia bacterium]|nr:mechanosensitive ion channel [Blastocatellia bacterium]
MPCWLLPNQFQLRTLAAVFLAPVLVAGLTAPNEGQTRKTDRLTVATLEARRKAIEADRNQDEAVKAELLERYRQALEYLKNAESWKRETEKLEALQVHAARQLQSAEPEASHVSQAPVGEIPPDATVKQLEQRLAQATVEADAITLEQNSRTGELKTLRERRSLLPSLTVETKQRLAGLKPELPVISETAGTDERLSARADEIAAAVIATEAEIRFQEKELATFDLREQLAIDGLESIRHRKIEIDKKIRLLQEAVFTHRKQEAETAVKQAQADIEKATHIHPAFRQIAQENAVWLEQQSGRDGVEWKVERANRELEALGVELESLSNEFNAINDRVHATGFSNSVGMILRTKRQMLPDVRTHRSAVMQREALLAEVQLGIIELEQRKPKTGSIEDQAQALFASLDLSLCGVTEEEALAFLRGLIRTREATRTNLLHDSNRYLEKLVDLNAREQELIASGQKYSDYIDEHIVWIRNLDAVSWADLPHTVQAVKTGFGWSWFHQARTDLIESVKSHPWRTVAAVVMIGLLLVERRYLQKRIRRSLVGLPEQTVPLSNVIVALGFTILNATLWPAAVWFVCRQIELAPEPTNLGRVFGAGLEMVVKPLLIWGIWHQMCLSEGLGEHLFGWTKGLTGRFRTQLGWAGWLVLPLIFLYGMVTFVTGESDEAVPSRLLFLGWMLVLAVCFAFLTQRFGEIRSALEKANPESWKAFGQRAWGWLLVGLPLVMGGIAAFGYVFAALHLTERLMVLALIGSGWFLFSQARLGVMVRSQAEAPAVNPADPSSETGPEAFTRFGGGWQTLETVLRVTALALGVVLAVHVWLTWVDVFPAFKSLEKVQLWTYPTEVREPVTGTGTGPAKVVTKVASTTLADVFSALLLAVIAITASKIIPRFLEVTVFQKLPFDQGGRYALKAVTHYVLIIAGGIMTFGKLGISWSTLQWLAAAVTFGLGFGLQEIFGNFVSGLIILFEQPVRVGDIVTVNGVTGRVTRIQIRATTITDFDRLQVIIPNKTFLTGQISNWSLTDSNRITLEIGVAYGSDTALVEKLLYRAAVENPYVLEKPAPRVVFFGFAHSTLNFKLQAHIPNRDVYWDAVHRLYNTINRDFQEAGVEIPFPQQDVHIRTGLEQFTTTQPPAPVGAEKMVNG